jgi:hypothetical protein
LHINITDIAWPDEIQDGINALNAAFSATFIFYCIGIGAAGLAIFLHGSRLVPLGNWALGFVSFFALAIASIIVTVFMVKATNLLNKYGNDVGLYACKGGKFLALTWSATTIMLLASVAGVLYGEEG